LAATTENIVWGRNYSGWVEPAEGSKARVRGWDYLGPQYGLRQKVELSSEDWAKRIHSRL